MKIQYILVLILFYQFSIIAQQNIYETKIDLKKYISEKPNHFNTNKNSALVWLLESNPTCEQVNEFILISYFKVKDFYLQSGYTAQIWNSSNWVNSMRLSVEFTQNGNEELALYENWDGSSWVNDKKYESIYNQNNKVQTYTYFLYSSGQWQPQYKLEYEYDSNNNPAAVTKYNFVNSNWETVTRDIYNYDANNNVTEKTSQQWSGTGWINQVKNFYTYDSNNNLTIALFTYWNNGAWINNQKYVYTYNQLNDFTEYLYQKWINSDWVNQFRYTYSYNSNNYLEVYLKQNWSTSNWENADKSTYSYDILGNRIQTMRELWSSNNWIYFQQTTNTYSDTLLIHYKLAEYNGSQWLNKSQTSISYDVNGNKDTEVYQSWVNNDWLNTNKFIYSHTLITDAETEINFPNDFKLEQNYPNPFNPTTKISWQSPVGSRQTLKVYDVLGNEVATLVDEYKSAGSYEVEFNANKLSSGTYFYRLTAGDFSETKKLALIK